MPRETVEFARSFEFQMQGEILFWKIYSNSIQRAHECQKKSDTFLPLFTFCLLASSSVSLLHLSLRSFSLYQLCFVIAATISYQEKQSQNVYSAERKGCFPKGTGKALKVHSYQHLPHQALPLYSDLMFLFAGCMMLHLWMCVSFACFFPLILVIHRYPSYPYNGRGHSQNDTTQTTLIQDMNMDINK